MEQLLLQDKQIAHLLLLIWPQGTRICLRQMRESPASTIDIGPQGPKSRGQETVPGTRGRLLLSSTYYTGSRFAPGDFAPSAAFVFLFLALSEIPHSVSQIFGAGCCCALRFEPAGVFTGTAIFGRRVECKKARTFEPAGAFINPSGRSFSFGASSWTARTFEPAGALAGAIDFGRQVVLKSLAFSEPAGAFSNLSDLDLGVRFDLGTVCKKARTFEPHHQFQKPSTPRMSSRLVVGLRFASPAGACGGTLRFNIEGGNLDEKHK